jgi:hypothetical protein
MSFDGNGGMVRGSGNTAAPSLIDGNQSEANGIYADLRSSFYGNQVVITHMGRTSATGRELRHAE